MAVMLDNCFELGYLVKPHGINGSIQAVFDTDAPEQYVDLESVFVMVKDNLVPYLISNLRGNGKKVIIDFEGVNTLEEAEKLRALKLYLPLEYLPKLGENQFYYHDIIGYKVRDVHMGDLGVVQNVYLQTSQDLIAMEYKGEEILIPVADNIVFKADHTEKLLFVELPEGLVDIYFS